MAWDTRGRPSLLGQALRAHPWHFDPSALDDHHQAGIMYAPSQSQPQDVPDDPPRPPPKRTTREETYKLMEGLDPALSKGIIVLLLTSDSPQTSSRVQSWYWMTTMIQPSKIVVGDFDPLQCLDGCCLAPWA